MISKIKTAVFIFQANLFTAGTFNLPHTAGIVALGPQRNRSIFCHGRILHFHDKLFFIL